MSTIRKSLRAPQRVLEELAHLAHHHRPAPDTRRPCLSRKKTHRGFASRRSSRPVRNSARPPRAGRSSSTPNHRQPMSITSASSPDRHPSCLASSRVSPRPSTCDAALAASHRDHGIACPPGYPSGLFAQLALELAQLEFEPAPLRGRLGAWWLIAPANRAYAARSLSPGARSPEAAGGSMARASIIPSERRRP